MNESGEKVCAICGSDCAAKPRVKDNKGRYYCKSCHEDALERQRAARAQADANGNDAEGDSTGASKIKSGFGSDARPAPPQRSDDSDDPIPIFDEDDGSRTDASTASDSYLAFGGDSVDESDIDDPLRQLAAASDRDERDDDASGAATRCPKCNTSMDAAAVLCVNCGYDMQHGSQLCIALEESHAPDDD